MAQSRHPESPILDHCPESLPVHAYLDTDWYRQEQERIWHKSWIAAGRINDLKPGTMKKVLVGEASVLLCRTPDGNISAFHNVCRHRGAELCSHEEQPLGRLVNCRYHAWSYAADDGRLMAVGSASPTVDFRKEDHGLARVSLKMWNGFIFLNLAQDPGLLEPDMGLHHLDNWPMETLVTGHRMVAETSCNWKVFWENYNECLHCPGVHPELSDLVPIYKKGIMGQREEPGWTPGEQRRPALKAGAKTWSGSGKACGPEFPNLTATERVKGANFVTVYPTMYLVAHVDYVRAVRLEPMGPEKTRLTAEWYFPQETLDQPGFDAAGVAAFARVVMAQDMDVTELNQRGFHSPAFSRGRLMPEEYSVHAFHKWVMRHMEPDA